MTLDSGTDPAEIKNKVIAYLEANPDTDAILTLGPTSADPTIEAVKEIGRDGDIYFGTFDLGTEIVKGIKEGVIQWGIDQQPFLQAYLPVIVLANYQRYGVRPRDVELSALVDTPGARLDLRHYSGICLLPWSGQ